MPGCFRLVPRLFPTCFPLVFPLFPGYLGLSDSLSTISAGARQHGARVPGRHPRAGFYQLLTRLPHPRGAGGTEAISLSTRGGSEADGAKVKRGVLVGAKIVPPPHRESAGHGGRKGTRAQRIPWFEPDPGGSRLVPCESIPLFLMRRFKQPCMDGVVGAGFGVIPCLRRGLRLLGVLTSGHYQKKIDETTSTG